MKRILFLIIAHIIIVLTSLFSLEIGDTAPRFANPDINGVFTLSKDIIGKGWVIIDFFATDCQACKKEIAELEELFEEFHDNGLTIIIFATDSEGLSLVEPYFEKNPTSMTVLLDKYHVIVQAYNVEEIPSVFLINPQGDVVYKAVGYNEKTVAEMRTILRNKL